MLAAHSNVNAFQCSINIYSSLLWSAMFVLISKTFLYLRLQFWYLEKENMFPEASNLNLAQSENKMHEQKWYICVFHFCVFLLHVSYLSSYKVQISFVAAPYKFFFHYTVVFISCICIWIKFFSLTDNQATQLYAL